MADQLANTGDGDAMTENSWIVAVLEGQLSKFEGIISNTRRTVAQNGVAMGTVIR
jgi:hypothetical protein